MRIRVYATAAAIAVLCGCAAAPPKATSSPTSTASEVDEIAEVPTPTPTVSPTYNRRERAFLAAMRKATDLDLPDTSPPAVLELAHEFCGPRDGESDPAPHAGDLVSMLDSRYEIGSVQRNAIRYLCPKYLTNWRRFSGAFKDGNLVVGKDVKPGTYRTLKRKVEDCYWERTSRGGQTLANNLVTFAVSGVTVTILAGDGGFTSRRCGYWIPA